MSDVTAGDMHLSDTVGRTVRSIYKLSDRAGEMAELQLNLVEGLLVFFTVWTDWSLRVEFRSEPGIPDYLWPPDEFISELVFVEQLKSNPKIRRVREEFDAVGILIGVDIELDSHLIEVRSHGGKLLVSLN